VGDKLEGGWRRKNLMRLLKGRRAGSWVVVNSSMTRVIAAGKTADLAIDRARAKEPKRKGSMLLKVRDPNLVYIY